MWRDSANVNGSCFRSCCTGSQLSCRDLDRTRPTCAPSTTVYSVQYSVRRYTGVVLNGLQNDYVSQLSLVKQDRSGRRTRHRGFLWGNGKIFYNKHF